MTRSSSFLAALRRRRGYTLIETLLSVLIISFMSTLVLVNDGTDDASTRLDRAAQTIIAALRYSRMLAMGHGQTTGSSLQPTDAYGVQINSAANTLTVYHTTWNSGTSEWNLPGTALTDGLFSSDNCVINLATDPAYAGVTISAVSLTGTADTTPNTASPYYCQYRPFGDTENPGTANAAITLSYGGLTRSIKIPAVGDPTEN
jgi:prepilin-type N-terminal cleavage/methylation domain-containing protein